MTIYFVQSSSKNPKSKTLRNQGCKLRKLRQFILGGVSNVAMKANKNIAQTYQYITHIILVAPSKHSISAEVDFLILILIFGKGL